MRKLLIIFVGLAALVACSRKHSEEDVAGQTAKAYYDQLVRGDYDSFVDGHWQPDSIPASYREQLVANAQMFMAQQEKEHGGISRVGLVRTQGDTVSKSANVFLNFTYGDSTTEEVVVPMVYRRGLWLMK